MLVQAATSSCLVIVAGSQQLPCLWLLCPHSFPAPGYPVGGGRLISPGSFLRDLVVSISHWILVTANIFFPCEIRLKWVSSSDRENSDILRDVPSSREVMVEMVVAVEGPWKAPEAQVGWWKTGWWAGFISPALWDVPRMPALSSRWHISGCCAGEDFEAALWFCSSGMVVDHQCLWLVWQEVVASLEINEKMFPEGGYGEHQGSGASLEEEQQIWINQVTLGSRKRVYSLCHQAWSSPSGFPDSPPAGPDQLSLPLSTACLLWFRILTLLVLEGSTQLPARMSLVLWV